MTPGDRLIQITFNADHYVVTDVEALNTPQARTTTTDPQPAVVW